MAIASGGLQEPRARPHGSLLTGKGPCQAIVPKAGREALQERAVCQAPYGAPRPPGT